MVLSGHGISDRKRGTGLEEPVCHVDHLRVWQHHQLDQQLIQQLNPGELQVDCLEQGLIVHYCKS